MVAGLDERFKQPCVAARVLRGLAEHFEKQLRRHELAARTRDKIPAGPDKLHALQVEFFIAPVRVFQRLAAFGKRGRVADDKAVLPSLAHVLPREIKDIGAGGRDDILHAVERCVAPHERQRVLGHVDRLDAFRAVERVVDGESARAAAQIEHVLSGRVGL